MGVLSQYVQTFAGLVQMDLRLIIAYFDISQRSNLLVQVCVDFKNLALIDWSVSIQVHASISSDLRSSLGQ
ncbi:hypothetical protein ACFYU8_18700 [Brevibacillus sp. NPDC003359]|uniref:hypothetical protein n=1 Tax=Brevibacillus sp. NPDC003359 TaxID=3363950 RepID=UPI0036AD2619